MTLVGVVFLVSGACSAIAQMFAGAASDRFGRRPLLLGTLLLSVFLYIGMALLIGRAAPVLAIAAAYAGVRSALMMMRPAIAAVVVDLSPRERLTETYGVLRVAQNLGWAAGPAMGGYLAASLPYAWLFGFAALISGIAFFFVVLRLRESFSGASEPVSVRSMFTAGADRDFLKFTVLSLLVFVVMGQMTSTLSVFTVDHAGFSTSRYGLLLTINGLLVVLLQYPATQVMGRAAKPAVLVLGSLLYGLGYLTMGWVGSFSLATAAMVVITLGEITLSPTTLAVVGEMSPGEWRGRYMGFYGLSETLGLSLGPLLGGFLLDVFPTRPLFIWGAISVVAMVAAVGFNRWGAGRRLRAVS